MVGAGAVQRLAPRGSHGGVASSLQSCEENFRFIGFVVANRVAIIVLTLLAKVELFYVNANAMAITVG